MTKQEIPYLQRALAPHFKRLLSQYPIVTLTGPRQSGKTTLSQHVCADYEYVSLEDPDTREFAISDARSFLRAYPSRVIFDEIQRAPELFSYIQSHVDQNSTPGCFVLTGSEQFLLNAHISQSLAGRAGRLTLLPLSLGERLQRPPQTLWTEETLTKFPSPDETDLYSILFSGSYPRLHDYNLDPSQFYRDYLDTYVSRDLQQLLNVGDLHLFRNFLFLLAGRCGQLVNLTSIGNDLGLTHTTIRRWLSVLEASYIITFHHPYYKNFNKRLVKTPKIYFLDTGLLCYLLRIQKIEELPFHSQIGGIFETYVMSELIKSFHQQNQTVPLYFWQERNGKEIDILIEKGESRLLPIEVKSSQTLSSQFFDNLNIWLAMKGNPQQTGYLIYGGDQWQKRGDNQVIPWFGIS